MGRFAKKRDTNEKAIIAALRALGAVVNKIEGVAGNGEDFGVPDLIVGYRGRTILVEVKNPDSNKGGRQLKSKGGSGKSGLTDTQVRWWNTWAGGAAFVVETPEEAVHAVRGVEVPEHAQHLMPMALSGGAIGIGLSGPVLSPDQADAYAGAFHTVADAARGLVRNDKSG